MRIIGIGTDIAEIDRIENMLEKHPESFPSRVFTPSEIRYCQGKNRGERFAARWAAKEAVMKAFGTGWTKDVGWTDIEVVRSESGKPSIRLHGGALRLSKELGITEVQISLSHCQTLALAFATAIGE